MVIFALRDGLKFALNKAKIYSKSLMDKLNFTKVKFTGYHINTKTFKSYLMLMNLQQSICPTLPIILNKLLLDKKSYKPFHEKLNISLLYGGPTSMLAVCHQVFGYILEVLTGAVEETQER